jgi:hypothetical protein
MNPTEQKQRLTSTDAKETKKRPYVKPEVRHERVFETMALTCGKVQVTQFNCSSNTKNS